jgi:plastocyanin
VVTINAGDFVEFQMPQNQAVLQVDQASFDANDSTPLPGGFSVAFGKTKKVKFAAPGTYYYVSPSSIELGMKGKIIVK